MKYDMQLDFHSVFLAIDSFLVFLQSLLVPKPSVTSNAIE